MKQTEIIEKSAEIPICPIDIRHLLRDQVAEPLLETDGGTVIVAKEDGNLSIVPKSGFRFLDEEQIRWTVEIHPVTVKDLPPDEGDKWEGNPKVVVGYEWNDDLVYDARDRKKSEFFEGAIVHSDRMAGAYARHLLKKVEDNQEVGTVWPESSSSDYRSNTKSSRYRKIIEEIASGAENPTQLAEEALEDESVGEPEDKTERNQSLIKVQYRVDNASGDRIDRFTVRQTKVPREGDKINLHPSADEHLDFNVKKVLWCITTQLRIEEEARSKFSQRKELDLSEKVEVIVFCKEPYRR